MSNQLFDTRPDGDTKFGAACSLVDGWVQRPWLLPFLLALLCLLCYAPFIACPPLLDEQFLLSWVHRSGQPLTPLGHLLLFRGFAPADLWGFNTTLFLKLSDVLLLGAPFLLRLERLVIHGGACVFLFLAVKKMLPSTWCAFAAAAIFAVYPLNPESVLWLGGTGSLLAGFLFIVSLWMYQKGHWPWLVGSLICFAASLLSSAAVWPLALFYACYEAFAWFRSKPGANGSDGLPGHRQAEPDLSGVTAASPDATMAVLAPLAFLVLAAAYLAGTGYLTLMSLGAGPHLHWSDIGGTFRACFLPINESIYSHYVRHYRFLYVALPPLALALAAALWRHRSWRLCSALVAAWLLLSLTAVFGHVDTRGTMFGAHLLYPAIMPLSCLLALSVCAIASALDRWRTVGGAASATAALIAIAFGLIHTWSQGAAYEHGAKVWTAVQKSMKIVYGKTQALDCMVRDIPSTVALLPGMVPNRMVVFDARRRLLASNVLSAGCLRDQLSQGIFRNITMRWADDTHSLMPVELGDESQAQGSTSDQTSQGDVHAAAQSAFSLDADQLCQRLAPSLEFYKQAHEDKQNGDLVLDSNSTSGPVIRFSASGFTPLGPDYLYIDAKIEAPKTEDRALVELYWTTRDHEKYDEKKRRVWTAAVIDDQKYHRYYLPLRSIGWVTGGVAEFLTLGFPAGAKVSIHALGGCGKTGVSPNFSVAAPRDLLAFQYDAPFFDFPTVPTLGLSRLAPSAPSVTVNYDCSEIAGATGVMVEISMPNQAFPNTNGNEASGVGGASVNIGGQRGAYEIPISRFPLPGVYGLRAIAVDANSRPVGQFSDDFYCLVTRPLKLGWAE